MASDDPDPNSAAPRTYARRELLKRAGLVVLGSAAAPLIAACVDNPPGETAGAPGDGDSDALSGSVTVLVGGGDPMAQPPFGTVYRDFGAQHPGIDWDIRAIPGGGPEWDRLARAAIASGEPVAFLMINGQQVRAWARDGLLADLDAEPRMAEVLARVPAQYRASGPGDGGTRAFPLALTQGVHTTGLYYNRALLDEAGLEAPTSIADLQAMVEPLSRIGVAPLVHCAGDVFFNQILITWMLPMVVERNGDPLQFADQTVRGQIGYDSPEWVEAFQTVADLRSSGVLLEGSGGTDYATMQQLLLQGKAATTFNGTWLLPQLLAASPTEPFDLHVAPPPLLDDAVRPRPIVAWTGFALPAVAAEARDVAHAFFEYASRPEVDRAVTRGSQQYSPIAASNVEIENDVAQEFLPLFDDAITPLDWLWEPEITAEIDSQVQALVRGDTDARSAARAVQAVAEELRATGRSYYS